MSALFDEVRFPVEISLGSKGGPMRQTQVVSLGSGAEARNARWRNSKRTYDAGYGIRSDDDLHEVLMFWEARNGRLIGFRFRDWQDWKSCPPLQTPSAIDQQIAIAAGSSLVYQLVKNYISGPRAWVRNITKPVQGTVKIAVDGAVVTNYTLDYMTGEITFLSAPVGTITWGGEFDVPVRFDTDSLMAEGTNPKSGRYPSIPMIEVPFDS